MKEKLQKIREERIICRSRPRRLSKLLKQMNSFKCYGEHIRRNTRMQQKLIMPV